MNPGAYVGLIRLENDPRDFLPEATRFLQSKNLLPGHSRTAFGGSEHPDSTSVVITKLRVGKCARGCAFDSSTEQRFRGPREQSRIRLAGA
jgi:hypothetical protein